MNPAMISTGSRMSFSAAGTVKPCEKGCGRLAAVGFRTCCRECATSNCERHSPDCNAAHAAGEAPEVISYCTVGCGRMCAEGYRTCCKLCVTTNGKQHADDCQSMVCVPVATRQCINGCGKPAYGRYKTCCSLCKGPDGPHAEDCQIKAEFSKITTASHLQAAWMFVGEKDATEPWKWSTWNSPKMTIQTMLQETRKDEELRIMVRGCDSWKSPKKFDSMSLGLDALNEVLREESGHTDKKMRPLRGKAFVFDLSLPDGSICTCSLGNDGKPLREHVIKCCEEYALGSIDFVLTLGKEHNTTQVLGTWDALKCLPGGSHVCIQSYDDVISECLDLLSTKPCRSLQRLLDVTVADDSLAEQLIRRDDMGKLLDKAFDEDDYKVNDLALMCLFELLQHETGVNWLAGCWPDRGQSIFVQLFRQIFPQISDPRQEVGYPALAVCLFLMEYFEDGRETAHMAAKDGGSHALYSRIIPAAMQRVYAGQSFQIHAAWAILGLILKDNFAVRSEDMKAFWRVTDGDDAELTGLFTQLQENYDTILISTLEQTCAKMRGGSWQALEMEYDELKEKYTKVRTQQDDAKGLIEKFRAQVRQAQEVHEKILPFVHFDESPIVVGEGMKTLAGRLGDWSKVDWPQGYTLLHYVCEYSKNPELVELMAKLCSDIDARDSDHKRAIDYAKANSPAIADVIRRYRPGGLESETATEDVAKPSAELAAIKTEYRRKDEEARKASPASSVPGTGPSTSSEKKTDGTALLPSMTEDVLLKYIVYAKEDRSEVMKKEMQDSVALGGLGLSEKDAEVAASRLTAMLALQRKLIEEEKASSQPAAKGKGKKGKGPPPPSSPEASEPDAGASKPPAKGKGKGKGGPPPPPPAKGKGKGPPPPPAKGGKKGPPAPPGKGGKGGPPAKGKGGKTGGDGGRSDVTPTVKMKLCRYEWSRYKFGKDPLTEGATRVWRKVPEDVSTGFVAGDANIQAEIQNRFSQTVIADKGPKETVTKKKESKITLDLGEKRMLLELKMKNFTARNIQPEALAQYLLKQDRNKIGPQLVKDCMVFADGLQAYIMQIEAKQKEEPDLPLGELEHYLYELRAVGPSIEQRLAVWSFLEELPSDVELWERNIGKLEKAIECFQKSTALPLLLAVALSICNFINGGNSQLSCADGFHIDAFGHDGCFSSLKDQNKKTLTELVLQTFIENYPDEAKLLFTELSPLLKMVRRKIGKTPPPDTYWDVQKEASITVEDASRSIGSLDQRRRIVRQKLLDAQKLVKDTGDPVHTDMDESLKKCEKQVDDLKNRSEATEASWKSLREWFCAEETKLRIPQAKPGESQPRSQEMKFTLFCQLWDDFFMPESLLLAKGDATIKSQIIPRFAKGRPVKLEDIQYLWGLPAITEKRRPPPPEEIPSPEKDGDTLGELPEAKPGGLPGLQSTRRPPIPSSSIRLPAGSKLLTRIPSSEDLSQPPSALPGLVSTRRPIMLGSMRGPPLASMRGPPGASMRGPMLARAATGSFKPPSGSTAGHMLLHSVLKEDKR